MTFAVYTNKAKPITAQVSIFWNQVKWASGPGFSHRGCLLFTSWLQLTWLLTDSLIIYVIPNLNTQDWKPLVVYTRAFWLLSGGPMAREVGLPPPSWPPLRRQPFGGAAHSPTCAPYCSSTQWKGHWVAKTGQCKLDKKWNWEARSNKMLWHYDNKDNRVRI